jgi:hypothetical protein
MAQGAKEMTFTEWWEQLTKAEHKSLGEKNARFVWEECQKYTLMTIEDACKAQVAYDQGHHDGYAQGRKHYEVQIAGWRLQPSLRPGMIWISDAGGEGGDFHIHELAEVIGKFYEEKF